MEAMEKIRQALPDAWRVRQVVGKQLGSHLKSHGCGKNIFKFHDVVHDFDVFGIPKNDAMEGCNPMFKKTI